MIRHNTNNNLLRSCKSINIHNKNLPAAQQQLVSSHSHFSSSQLGGVIFLDLIILGALAVVSGFFYDILTLLSNLIDLFKTTNYDIMCNMTSYSNTREATTIIHSNEGWAQRYKKYIHIWNWCIMVFHLLRSGGKFLQRGFIIGSSIAADAATTALINAINDHDYVENHINNWNRVFRGVNYSTLELNVSKDLELNKLTAAAAQQKKFLPDDIDFNAISEKIINAIIDHIKPILEPVHVEYTNELLANQIYVISIILFILSIMIIILLYHL